MKIIPDKNASLYTCAELMIATRSAGQAVSASDACIAATAKANGMMVATRDAAPFEAAGLRVIDPCSA